MGRGASIEPTTGRYWSRERSEVLADPKRSATYTLRRLVVQSLDDRPAARVASTWLH